MDNIDDDLKSLLDQLGDDEPSQPAPSQPEAKPVEPVADAELDAALDQLDEPQKPEPPAAEEKSDALRPVKVDIKRLDETPALDEAPVESSSDVIKYLDKMEEVADEVLIACRNDRQEAQDVINMLKGQCDMAHEKSIPPARMYVDGLVKAVEVKANINGNAVKVMEGVAKMIAATKAGVNVQNNNISVSGAELDEILSGSEPMGGDLD